MDIITTIKNNIKNYIDPDNKIKYCPNLDCIHHNDKFKLVNKGSYIPLTCLTCVFLIKSDNYKPSTKNNENS